MSEGPSRDEQPTVALASNERDWGRVAHWTRVCRAKFGQRNDNNLHDHPLANPPRFGACRFHAGPARLGGSKAALSPHSSPAPRFPLTALRSLTALSPGADE